MLALVCYSEGMIVVIIAGGSGTRLWPLSTPAYPKHLLKINGDDRSLLQNAYDRAKLLTNTIYVITEAGHAHHVQEQLPDLPESAFIIEPARRGTASCIVAGLEHIARESDRDEPIAFMAADHYVRDVAGFRHSFEVAARISKQEGSLVLVGVEPDHPATGFGYIQKGELVNEDQFVFSVVDFKEKPTHDVAQNYLRSGNYLWNCGYFVASTNTFLSSMERHAPELLANFRSLENAPSREAYTERYLGFENIAIDYALIEKADDLLVVPASFDWMDLGSFADIAKAVSTDEAGNYRSGYVEVEEAENTFVQNLEDKPVAVIGLDNVVVVNTPHGILVARKDLAQKVGEVSKRLQQ